MIIYTKHQFINEPAQAHKYTTINVEKYKSINQKGTETIICNITLYLNSLEIKKKNLILTTVGEP